ncbi:hypothetical protein [Oryzihumus sp.]|uniref:hypothetical protein n=1 Tax=Oryzihumus sp. TaxID=1968903 RepID=UPI002ED94736
MSTRPDGPGSPRVSQPAERALFTRLFDDAAVFPPGLAPLPRAVGDHLARRTADVADLVGPLLVPASAAEELLTLPLPGPSGRSGPALTVALIGRPGVAVAAVGEALSRLSQDGRVEVAGVEVGWSPGWELALDWQLPVSVEVPRGTQQAKALRDVAAHAGGREGVQAKFRTGATATTDVPAPHELAGFVRACIDADLGFKLTGGLHHAVTGTHDGEQQFGFLNVLHAVRWALNGAEVDELEPLLAEQDPEPVLEAVSRMSIADASITRAFFTAYGCCGVMDPIGELSTLGLIEETTV